MAPPVMALQKSEMLGQQMLGHHVGKVSSSRARCAPSRGALVPGTYFLAGNNAGCPNATRLFRRTRENFPVSTLFPLN